MSQKNNMFLCYSVLEKNMFFCYYVLEKKYVLMLLCLRNNMFLCYSVLKTMFLCLI